MFNFLKSVESLEKDIREWAYRNVMKIMPPEESKCWREHYTSMPIEEVLTEVSANCLSEMKRAEIRKKMTGEMPIPSEIWIFWVGHKLCVDFAKRKGWEIFYEGVPLIGYTCKIIKRNENW